MEKLTGPLPRAAELRRLGEQMENTMEDCFKTMSSDFKEPIVELTARVAHLFRERDRFIKPNTPLIIPERFVDLHQLTVALNPILSNPDQVRDMLVAWDGLNTASLADQCALSGNCEQDPVNQLLSDFHLWLEDTQSSAHAIDRLGEWIEKAVSDLGDTVKAQVDSTCLSSETDLGRIVPRAGFLTSQVMRDFVSASPNWSNLANSSADLAERKDFWPLPACQDLDRRLRGHPRSPQDLPLHPCHRNRHVQPDVCHHPIPEHDQPYRPLDRCSARPRRTTILQHACVRRQSCHPTPFHSGYHVITNIHRDAVVYATFLPIACHDVCGGKSRPLTAAVEAGSNHRSVLE
jgi:hypothetical protein